MIMLVSVAAPPCSASMAGPRGVLRGVARPLAEAGGAVYPVKLLTVSMSTADLLSDVIDMPRE